MLDVIIVLIEESSADLRINIMGYMFCWFSNTITFWYHQPSIFRNLLIKLHLIMVLFSTLLSTSIFWLRFMFSIFVCDTIIVYAYSLYVRYDTSYVWSARLRFMSYFYILLTHRRDENLLNSSILVSIFMIVRIHE